MRQKGPTIMTVWKKPYTAIIDTDPATAELYHLLETLASKRRLHVYLNGHIHQITEVALTRNHHKQLHGFAFTADQKGEPVQ